MRPGGRHQRPPEGPWDCVYEKPCVLSGQRIDRACRVRPRASSACALWHGHATRLPNVRPRQRRALGPSGARPTTVRLSVERHADPRWRARTVLESTVLEPRISVREWPSGTARTARPIGAARSSPGRGRGKAHKLKAPTSNERWASTAHRGSVRTLANEPFCTKSWTELIDVREGSRHTQTPHHRQHTPHHRLKSKWSEAVRVPPGRRSTGVQHNTNQQSQRYVCKQRSESGVWA